MREWSGATRNHGEEADCGPAFFFGVLYQAFLRAERAAGSSTERRYVIGDCCVRLRFAGPAMVTPLTESLEHLASESRCDAVLEVCVWDSVSTGTRMPRPPWAVSDYLPRGEVRGHNNRRIRTALNLGSGALSMLDLELNRALFWIRDASTVPGYEKAAPLRSIIHWWALTKGFQLVHAASVGTADGAVLLAGKGGAGKSSTAVACLLSGMLYLADDYALVRTEPEPTVFSLYNSAKLDKKSLKRLRAFADVPVDLNLIDGEKVIQFMWQRDPERMCSTLPVRAILLPRVTGRHETRIVRTTSAAGLAGAAPSTVFQLAGSGPEGFHNIGKFIKKVPSFVLELGENPEEICQAIRRLLSELRSDVSQASTRPK